jgi:hypothetical protein
MLTWRIMAPLCCFRRQGDVASEFADVEADVDPRSTDVRVVTERSGARTMPLLQGIGT